MSKEKNKGKKLEETAAVVLSERTLPLKMINLGMTLAHPVKANVDVILEPHANSSDYRNHAILIPDKKSGKFDLIGNISTFRDAVMFGQDQLQGLILDIDPDYLAPVQRILNREALPFDRRLYTLTQLLELYDEGGLLSYARLDNGSPEGLVSFLAEALMEDEDEIRMSANLYWLDRDDLREMVYDGDLCLHQANKEALEEAEAAEAEAEVAAAAKLKKKA